MQSTIRKLKYCCLLVIMLIMSSCGITPSSSAIRTSPLRVVVSPPEPLSPTVVSSPTPMVGLPVRLLIPSIQVDAPIEAVGITPNSDLATPKQHEWDGAGWYSAGPRPGERGSAVIDGHLDRPGGAPSVFWNLRSMHVGESIMVVDTDGKTQQFRVIRIASYLPQEAPVQEIFGNMSGTYLNFITCAGDWIPSQHQTTLRLVVYTSLLARETSSLQDTVA